VFLFVCASVIVGAYLLVSVLSVRVYIIMCPFCVLRTLSYSLSCAQFSRSAVEGCELHIGRAVKMCSFLVQNERMVILVHEVFKAV